MTMNIPTLVFVSAILSQQVTCDVDKDWMRKTLSEHFSAPRHHVTNPAYKNAAMTFIRDQFRGMGLETHIHTFSTLLPNVTGVNVIGLLKGRYFNTPDDGVVGIAAHYDTIRNTPGVNDNGAAVVAMLQAARELSRHSVRNATIFFLGFDFEESEGTNDGSDACKVGLCGSKALVTEWLPNFWPETVNWKGIFVLDTIFNFDDIQQTQNIPLGVEQVLPDIVADVDSDGRRGDFLMVAGRRYEAPLVTLLKDTWNTLGDIQYEIEAIVLPPFVPNPATLKSLSLISDFARSDHAIFWMSGYRAVFLTDTANFRGYMKQCYHSPCDNLTHVSDAKIGFIAKTASTLISVVDNLAPVADGRGPCESETLDESLPEGTAVQCTNHFVILPALLVFTFASF